VQIEGVPPPVGRRPAEARLDVRDASLETRRLAADPGALARLARQTGGQVVPLDELAARFAGIADRSVRVPDDVREPLWRTKMAWLLFVLLIGTEWILRKVYGMI
jgi:hypothetical protein